MQHGQVFELKTTGPSGQRLWAYRYRLDGRGSRRIQRGGYASADDAREALQRALIAAQRRKGRVRVTLADLAEEYLAQHDGEPETTAKLRWLLTKSTAAFGSMPLTELDARAIAAWRMTLPAGHRFEATQALRQTLARAVEWGLLDANPAKTGVDNPQPPRREMHPFDTDGQLEALAAELGPRYGPMVLFAAATAPASRRMDRARAPRHRPQRPARPRPPSLPRQPPQAHQDQHRARRAAPAIRARRARPTPVATQRDIAPVPRPRGRLPRPAQLAPHWRPARRAAGITPTRRLYEYADLLVMPSLPRRSCSERLLVSGCRHNQSASRKARSASGGW
jgi:hypothetical protein